MESNHRKMRRIQQRMILTGEIDVTDSKKKNKEYWKKFGIAVGVLWLGYFSGRIDQIIINQRTK